MRTKPLKCFVTIVHGGEIGTSVVDCLEDAHGPYLVLPINGGFPEHPEKPEKITLRVPSDWLVEAEEKDYRLLFWKTIQLDQFDGRKWRGPAFEGAKMRQVLKPVAAATAG